MDDVLVRANVSTLGFNPGDTGWLALTPMVDGAIRRGYLTVLEVRPESEDFPGTIRGLSESEPEPVLEERTQEMPGS